MTLVHCSGVDNDAEDDCVPTLVETWAANNAKAILIVLESPSFASASLSRGPPVMHEISRDYFMPQPPSTFYRTVPATNAIPIQPAGILDSPRSPELSSSSTEDGSSPDDSSDSSANQALEDLDVKFALNSADSSEDEAIRALILSIFDEEAWDSPANLSLAQCPYSIGVMKCTIEDVEAQGIELLVHSQGPKARQSPH
ncbi:hypothetical protein AN958_03330 [Leucoagaricus sp. SymC.cos]|nr:hypothetical protein AN958_03330 [Leucoagaricus sp. SymC.cos]